METRAIGGLQVSVVGLGCNNFGGRCDAEQTARVVDTALDQGVTLFDTADMYSDGRSEEFLGRALRGKREKAVIATKFGYPMDNDPKKSGSSARWIAAAVEDSLRRLETDYIDLYQQHVPDPNVPIDETLDALDRLVKAGKVRQIGTSNASGTQIESALAVSRAQNKASFVSVQNYLNLLKQDTLGDMKPVCAKAGLSILPYFPLESGVLTGKYRGGAVPKGTRLSGGYYKSVIDQFLSPEQVRKAAALEAFATARGRTLIELAFGWLLSEPLIASVIAGASKPEQVVQNVAAAHWTLTPAEAAEAARIGRGAAQ